MPDSAPSPWTETGGLGAGRPGRSCTPKREGDPLRSYGKVAPSSWSFPLWFSGSAGQCPSFFPPSGLRRLPGFSFCPGSHGAAAGAQEVINAGSGEREGGGGCGAGAARPGWSVTTSPIAGPSRACRGSGGRSHCPAACALGEGVEGRQTVACPAAGLAWRAWKVGDSAGLPAARLLGLAEFSLVATSRSQGDVKLGYNWAFYNHVDFVVKCFS